MQHHLFKYEYDFLILFFVFFPLKKITRLLTWWQHRMNEYPSSLVSWPVCFLLWFVDSSKQIRLSGRECMSAVSVSSQTNKDPEVHDSQLVTIPMQAPLIKLRYIAGVRHK